MAYMHTITMEEKDEGERDGNGIVNIENLIT